MLTTRPGKRDKVGLLNTDLIMDVMDGEAVVGSLVYDKKAMRATITIGAATCTVDNGGDKRLINPWTLKNAAGKILALAQQTKASFAVSRGEEAFTLRKKGRPFELVRQGNEQPLGTVGQEKFFTRALHMRLPADFDPTFQVFLLALVLTYTLQEMEKSTT